MSGYNLWQKQILAIVSLEWRKTMFSRRGLWVYALAFLPALLFGMNMYFVKKQRANQEQVILSAPNAVATSAAIKTGMHISEVTRMLDESRVKYSKSRRGKLQVIRYADGNKSWLMRFREDLLTEKADQSEARLSENVRAFAGVFQYFFLRLAIFFGCVGIFMNLFRGEMLDQSLHHYLLSPVRREVLMVGKYLAGLIATIAIFCTSTALQFFLMISAHPAREVDVYMTSGGWSHFFTYLGVAALACVGYGSIFLAAGIIMRNPLIPAAVILFWEGINWFLPAMLKKFSIIYYLQSLSPVVAPLNSDIPEPLKLLVTTAAPIPAPMAVLGIFAAAATVLAFASIYVKKLEINYGSD